MRARSWLTALAALAAAVLMVGVARRLRTPAADPSQARAMAMLGSAPGSDVVFRDGALLDRVSSHDNALGRATESTWYGTDVGESVITTFFDAELPSRGYHAVALDAVADPMDRADPIRELRRYARADGFVYSVLVAPLPRRVGGRSISSGYERLLVTRLSVQ